MGRSSLTLLALICLSFAPVNAQTVPAPQAPTTYSIRKEDFETSPTNLKVITDGLGTTQTSWQPYTTHMEGRLSQAWGQVPMPGRELVLHAPLPDKFQVVRQATGSWTPGQQTITVVFQLDRRGEILSLSITESSGNQAQDERALAVVRQAAPFGLWPDGIAGDKLSVQWRLGIPWLAAAEPPVTDTTLRTPAIEAIDCGVLTEKPLQTGNILSIGLKGTPGHQASFALPSNREIPMRERAPGRYLGSIQIGRGMNVPASFIKVKLGDGQKVDERTCAHPIAIQSNP